MNNFFISKGCVYASMILCCCWFGELYGQGNGPTQPEVNSFSPIGVTNLVNPATGDLVTGDLESETRQVMENIKAILDAAELTFEHVVKVSVFVKDMHMFSRINAVYAEYFNDATAPARELVEVANLPKFVNIEISVTAVLS